MSQIDQEIRVRAASYLRLADCLLPGWVSGFYLVGSAALGEYRPGKSDLDFVAVVSSGLDRAGLQRLRGLHLTAGADAALRSAIRGRSPLSGTANGVFVRQSDVHLPVSKIEPVASHVGTHFMVGQGFDVNPVVWKVLAEQGLTIRGPAVATLNLDPEPGAMRQWNLDNLNSYWLHWGEAVAKKDRFAYLAIRLPRAFRHMIAWGVLGAPRLHCTVATGRIVGKLCAGEYALNVFHRQWQPLVNAALAYWRGEAGPTSALPRAALRLAGRFVLEVVASANELS